MKTILFALAAWALTAAVSYGQFDSPEDEQGKPAQDKAAKSATKPKSATKAKPTKAKTGEAAYENFPEPWRSRFVEDWKKAIEDEQNLLKPAKGKKSNPSKASKTKMNDIEKTIAKLKKNVPPYFKRLSFKVGSYGNTPGNLKIIQVTPPDKLLVRMNESVYCPATVDHPYSTVEHWVLLKIPSTNGMTDGRMLDRMFLNIIGTTTYPKR